MAGFKFYKQTDSLDCGPSCLRMVARFHGRALSARALAERARSGPAQGSMQAVSKAAEGMGFQTVGVRLNFEKLAREATLPCVVDWNQNHLVVLYGFKKRGMFRSRARNRFLVQVADPARGLMTYTPEEFMTGWLGQTPEAEHGTALLLEPTPAFYRPDTDDDSEVLTGSFRRAYTYLLKYKGLLMQLLIGLVVGSGLQFFLPFLAQSVVDIGINTHNLNFVYLILIAQITLFTSQTVVDFIRGWILLHISSRVNVLILSDFLSKLLRLPMSFFDVKLFGDIMQRIHDHDRIEAFLTSTSLSALFSLLNLMICGVVLAIYSTSIFVVFLVGTAAYVLWALVFLKSRRRIDAARFQALSRNQSAIIQLIQGVREIKLANSEQQKRWEWERIQAGLFKLTYQGLANTQYQKAGAVFLNEGKNILITFLSAKAVIDGHLTLGSMLTIQYIIGQLNKPVEQLILFTQTWQDAQMSLERLNEIHRLPDEEPAGFSYQPLPAERSISLKGVDFAYPGAETQPILHGIDLHIPAGKTTALVGTSGSGKTTLLKLLLKFYQPGAGTIRTGHVGLEQVSQEAWRNACGVVMQDGFLFSDTVARNIAVGEERPDPERLLHAVQVASIEEYVAGLPLGFNTKIGLDGSGMSQGQRQRLLIARAVYKNPSFLFLDEATSSLDATNESIILHNLEQFLTDRTVVVVAHRLSTVRKADNIVVLHHGRIVEQGPHEALVAARGHYYTLVKNQLELGS